MLSSWRVSPGEIGEKFHLDDLAQAFDKGELLRNDFLGPVAKHFADNFDSTLDHVTGLFDSEGPSVSEFLQSPVEKFTDYFGLESKCTGPGFICGKKIPDACVVRNFYCEKDVVLKAVIVCVRGRHIVL